MATEHINILLAIWGAALSTILGVMQLFKFSNDKPSVQLYADFIFNSISKDDECKGTKALVAENRWNEILLQVKVANSGRRALQITSVIFENATGGSVQVIPEGLPVVLDPLVSIEVTMQKEWLDSAPVTMVGVTDALGNKHKLKAKMLQSLQERNKKFPTNWKKYIEKDNKDKPPLIAFQVKDKATFVNGPNFNKAS